MPTNPLSNFEIQKHCQPKFNDAYSRNDLSEIKNGTYITSVGEYESIGTHWIALTINAKNITYFASFGVEHIPKQMRKIVRHKNIIKNIYRIQAFNSMMC